MLEAPGLWEPWVKLDPEAHQGYPDHWVKRERKEWAVFRGPRVTWVNMEMLVLMESLVQTDHQVLLGLQVLRDQWEIKVQRELKALWVLQVQRDMMVHQVQMGKMVHLEKTENLDLLELQGIRVRLDFLVNRDNGVIQDLKVPVVPRVIQESWALRESTEL